MPRFDKMKDISDVPLIPHFQSNGFFRKKTLPTIPFSEKFWL